MMRLPLVSPTAALRRSFSASARPLARYTPQAPPPASSSIPLHREKARERGPIGRTVVRESGNERPPSLKFTHVPRPERSEREDRPSNIRGGRYDDGGMREGGRPDRRFGRGSERSERHEEGFGTIDDSRDLRGGRRAYDDNVSAFQREGPREGGRARFSPPPRYTGRASPDGGAVTVELPEGVYYKRAPPKEVPYPTTDTAEFLYGANSVQAALEAGRRRMYRLFLYKGENQEIGTRRRLERLMKLAEGKVEEVVWERDGGVLDALSKSRPHNGCILECEPVTQIPVLSLLEVAEDRASFGIRKAQHTDLPVRLNELPSAIQCRDPERRFPIVLVLDEILDPGNLGAIIRTAYYLGLDALCISSKNCAPISPTTIKSSSGSTEYLPLLATDSPLSFLKATRAAGWTIIGAVPPSANDNPHAESGKIKGVKVLDAFQLTPKIHLASKETNDLMRKGVVLVMGGEGEGLRENVRRELNYVMQVPKGVEVVGGVDSLNVSVAAGLLCGALVGMERRGVVGKPKVRTEEEVEEGMIF